ncbi:MAG: cytochrome c peroxidase, partial [Planctomycetia bacterium]
MDKPGSWSRTNMHWETKTIDFVAKQDGIGLRFSSNTDGIPDGPVISQVEVFSPLSPPGALDSLPVPLPPNLMDFVADKDKAIALGKAFFWDMQVGSDGRTACASCHWHAGADVRTVNTANPGKSGSLFRGVNKTLKSSDFPFHKFKDPTVPGDSVSNPVIADVREVIGSQGVITANFAGVKSGSAIDMTVGKVLNPTFMSQYSNVRQVTGRNAPSTVNAVFFDRSFWDGRANRYFNGVNPFGELDSNARVLKANAAGQLESVQIQLDNAALASQAVGPANSDVEMAWTGRSFAELGRKMLSLRPLSQQKVAVDDSVLGIYLDSSGRGLDLNQAAYAKLIREAFLPEWWSGVAKTSDGYTQMEANFSLYWGLAIMMYESTLVSDQAPYDRYARGDKDALTAQAKEGLRIFVKEGKCLNCHHGPEFAGGTISNLRGVLSEDGGVSLMKMAQGIAFYDEGFYNIGVRPTTEDLGVGGSHPLFGPLSYGRQEQAGRNPDPGDVVTPDQRVAVDGAFKAPTLRNVELTGPYMHNGSMKSLTEVIEFYTRGSDFHDSNLKDLDTDVGGISALQGNPAAIASVVEFLEHLTDPRVKYQKAPFDHPELVLPNGHSALVSRVWLDNLLLLPETGKNGGSALSSFEDVLTNGLGLEALQMPQVPMSAETAAAEQNTTPARTPPNATMLSQQALSKDALLGNRTSKVTATTAEPVVPETAVVVGPEAPEPVATAEVVVPEAPAVVEVPEVPEVVVPEAPAAVEVAETVANEGGVSLVKTPPTQELLAAKATAKEALLGNRTSAVIAPEAPGAVEAPEAPEADGAAEVVVPEVPEVVEVAEPVANEGDVSLVKTPPTQELLDAKSEEKEELLGNRTSPEEKAELLSDRTSSITDPIAIGADDGDAPDAGETDPAEEADPAEPVAPVDPAEEADPEEPVAPVDPAEEADTEESVTPVDPAEEPEAGEVGTSLVKTPPTQELLDAKSEEKEELLGNR